MIYLYSIPLMINKKNLSSSNNVTSTLALARLFKLSLKLDREPIVGNVLGFCGRTGGYEKTYQSVALSWRIRKPGLSRPLGIA